jgi:hypothetical protein
MFSCGPKKKNNARDQIRTPTALDSPVTPSPHRRSSFNDNNAIPNRPLTGTPAPWTPRLSVLARFRFNSISLTRLYLSYVSSFPDWFGDFDYFVCVGFLRWIEMEKRIIIIMMIQLNLFLFLNFHNLFVMNKLSRRTNEFHVRIIIAFIALFLFFYELIRICLDWLVWSYLLA